jgi:formylglycine-generating enzyme required for sulfatase activity
MAGNVLEWCRDRFYSKYYEISPDSNPQGPPAIIDGEHLIQRVLRGGDFRTYHGFSQTTVRYLFTPNQRGITNGFRCVIPCAAK